MTLTDVFDRYGVPWKPAKQSHHVRAGWVGVDCPNCSPGWSKWRLGFELATGRCNCWVCGKTDPTKALATLCNITHKEAISLWMQLPKSGYLRLPETSGTLVMPEAGELLPVHKRYLRGRGFDPEELQRLWCLKGIGQSLKLQWRILIPISDPYGRVVSWTTRSIADDPKLRYISASPEEESYSHKKLLFGAQYVRHSIVVCEGPFSAMAVGPGAVATCGVGFSAEQMALIASYPLRAILFDAEPAAQRRAENLCRSWSVVSGITENIELETGDDPAECDKAEITEIRNKYLAI